MAYSITLDPLTTGSWTMIDRHKYLTVEITQAAVDPAVTAEHEWSLDVPPYVTVLEHRVVVTDDAGGAVTSITPELGLASAWVTDDANHLLTLTPAVAGLVATSFEQPAFAVSGGTLYGRAVPDAAGGTIKTRITLREG